MEVDEEEDGEVAEGDLERNFRAALDAPLKPPAAPPRFHEAGWDAFTTGVVYSGRSLTFRGFCVVLEEDVLSQSNATIGDGRASRVWSAGTRASRNGSRKRGRPSSRTGCI